MYKSIGKSIFKRDKNKPFTEEQLAFARKFENVDIEINNDHLVILSESDDLVGKVANEIA